MRDTQVTYINFNEYRDADDFNSLVNSLLDMQESGWVLQDTKPITAELSDEPDVTVEVGLKLFWYMRK